MRVQKRPQAAAFSLLEIMVAVALLAVIIVGLLAMFYQVQRAFRAGTAQADVMEGGRATMSLLTRELQEMAATDVEFTTNFLVVPSESPPLPPDARTVQVLPSGVARMNFLRDLCFMTRVNDEWIGTAYRVSNAVESVETLGVGTLYRLVERRTNDSNPQIRRQITSELSRFISEATPRTTTNFHQVLDGVVHFSAEAYDTNGMIFTNAFFGMGYGFTNGMLPAYVDLEMAILEPGAVAKFRARADNSIGQATNYLARQSGRTHLFRQRIAIKPGATTYD